MSVVLSVYSQSAYKEFVLPAIHNAETVLVIDRRVFHLKDSIELRLEEMDGNWTFLQSSHYEITENSEIDSGSRLKDQATYILKIRTGRLSSGYCSDERDLIHKLY